MSACHVMCLLESNISLSLYHYRYDRMRGRPPLVDAHCRLTRELWLAVGSSGSVSLLLLPVSWSPHTMQRGSRHSLLMSFFFRTDDLSSQHNLPKKWRFDLFSNLLL